MREDRLSVVSVIRKITDVIWVLRAPFIFSLICLFLFSQPKQIIEIYVFLAQDAGRQWPQIVMAFASLAALGFILFALARDLTIDDSQAMKYQLSQPTITGYLLRLAPGGFSLIPFIGVIWGMTSARDKFEDYCVLQEGIGKTFASDPSVISAADTAMTDALSQSCRLAGQMEAAILISIAVALVIFMISLRSASVNIHRFEERRTSIFSFRTSVWFAVLNLVLIALFTAQNLSAGSAEGADITMIAQFLGVLVIINLFLICSAYVFSRLTWLNRRFQLPVIVPFLAAAVIFSYFNLNDNHAVRTIKVEGSGETPSQSILPGDAKAARVGVVLRGTRDENPDPLGRPYLGDAFRDWFAARPKAYMDAWAERTGKLYPIYIVAAQGGGLYAAELTALTLARLYDRCPDMRHHVFAVSGVSGGAVGAGFFNAILQDAIPRDGCDVTAQSTNLEKAVSSVISWDYLSPLAGSALFPDVLQRFLPWTWWGIFDRARAFEATLEHVADTLNPGLGSRTMRAPFLKHWTATGPSPMLVLNTTSVDEGKQMLIAPFRELSPDSYARNALHNTLALTREDISLSSALTTTARFPIVLPAGLFKGSYEQEVQRNGQSETVSVPYEFRLVDGGYFENSGAAVALEMLRELRAVSGLGNACIWSPESKSCVNMSGNADDASIKLDLSLMIMTEKYTLQPAKIGLNELFAPLKTLLNTRVERGLQAITNARTVNSSTHTISINHDQFNMPLGWQFSPQTQNLIAAQISTPELCLDFEPRQERNVVIDNSIKGGVIDADIGQFVHTLQENPCVLKDIVASVRDGVPLPAINYRNIFSVEQLQNMAPSQ